MIATWFFYFIAEGLVADQPLIVHPHQHRDFSVHVIINLYHLFIVVKAMETADILLEGTPSGDGHDQEQRIQAGIVKPLSNIPAGGQDQSLFPVRDGLHLIVDGDSLLFSHTAL